MAAIAAFASSIEGKRYAAVCDRWGVDPAACISDDVAAYALRAALFVTIAQELPAPADEWEAAGAANEREWLKAAQ
jgi:hypothetical protein